MEMMGGLAICGLVVLGLLAMVGIYAAFRFLVGKDGASSDYKDFMTAHKTMTKSFEFGQKIINDAGPLTKFRIRTRIGGDAMKMYLK